MHKTYAQSFKQHQLGPVGRSARRGIKQHSSLRHGPSISCQVMTLWEAQHGIRNTWTVLQRTAQCQWHCHWILPPKTGLTAFNTEWDCIRCVGNSSLPWCRYSQHLHALMFRASVIVFSPARKSAACYSSQLHTQLCPVATKEVSV